MSPLRLLILTVLLLVNFSLAQPPGEAVLVVAGMTCQEGCAVRVHEALSILPGVFEVEVDFEASRARVRFDPGVTSAPALARGLEVSTQGRFLARPESGPGNEDHL